MIKNMQYALVLILIALLLMGNGCTLPGSTLADPTPTPENREKREEQRDEDEGDEDADEDDDADDDEDRDEDADDDGDNDEDADDDTIRNTGGNDTAGGRFRTESTGSIEGIEPFDYTPGGETYALDVETLPSNWQRVRQAANGQYLPWTFLFHLSSDVPINGNAQWDSATKLNLYGTDNQTTHYRLLLRRDLESSENWVEIGADEDPYDAATTGQGGLGWFFTGNKASVTINGHTEFLTGPGVPQADFPRFWNGWYIIEIEIAPGGLVVINQGEKMTSVNTWDAE